MSELFDVADRVLGWVTDSEAVEVVVAHSRETEVRAFEGEVESFVSSATSGVAIRVVEGLRQGFAWAGSHDPDVLAETLAEARDNARFSSEDANVGLAVPDGVEPPPLTLYDERIERLTPEQKIELALELERRVVEGDPRIVGVESADYSDGVSETAVVSTTGIRSFERESGCSLSVYSLACADRETTTGFGFSVARSPDGLDLETAAAEAVERAVRMLGAIRVPTGRATVVLDPWVAAQVLSIVAEAFSGGEVLRGRSWVADRVGDAIGPAMLSVADDPTDARWFGAATVDAEGLATRTTSLIEAGVVRGFVHDSYSARGSGASSTGSAVRAGYRSMPSAGVQSVVVVPGDRDPTQVLSMVGEGIFVSEVQGLHSGVNPVSGDFSTGIEGLVIRGGELAEPTKEVTIASTLQRMLANIVAVGNDLTALPLDATGVTLAISDVSVSGS